MAVLALAVGLPLLTPLLNGLKPAGLPLGHAIVAQGVPLLFALLIALVTWARRHDH